MVEITSSPPTVTPKETRRAMTEDPTAVSHSVDFMSLSLKTSSPSLLFSVSIINLDLLPACNPPFPSPNILQQFLHQFRSSMKTVLNSLLQVFPQIDMRILRAVADEFPRDVDSAVEFILSDVIPIVSAEPPEETSSHVHAPPELVLDAHHPPTGMQQQMEVYVLKKQGNKIR